MEMVFCQKCGAENKDDDMFCTSCGRKLVLGKGLEPERQQAEPPKKAKTDPPSKTPTKSGKDPRWLYSVSLIISLMLAVFAVLPLVTDLYLIHGYVQPRGFYSVRFWAEVAFAAGYGLLFVIFLWKRTSKRALVLPAAYLLAFGASQVFYPSVGWMAGDAFRGFFVLIALLSALTR